MRASSTLLFLANAITIFALPQHADHNPVPSAPVAKGATAPKSTPSMAKGTSAPKAKPKTVEEAAPLIKAAKVISMKPVLRENAIREQVRFGPFILPPMNPDAAHGHGHDEGTGVSSGKTPGTQDLLTKPLALVMVDYLGSSMDPDGFGILNTITGSICSDCTVLANQIDVVFEDGKRADLSSGVYLHHIITMDIATDRRVASNMVDSWVPFCTGMNSFIQSLTSVVSSVVGLFSQNFEVAVFSFGAVDEFKQLWTTPDGKFNSGYYLGKKDKLLMQAEIVNYNKDSKQVYLQYDIEYVKGKAGKPATTSFITTTACDQPLVFMGKGGKGVNSGGKLNVKQAGTILNARGHMHDGGEAMKVYVNDKAVCQSDAIYGQASGGGNWTTISKMVDCIEPIPVKKGDTVRIDALYDSIAHPLRTSGGKDQAQMGLVAMSFVPS